MASKVRFAETQAHVGKTESGRITTSRLTVR
jgi:hypothetical protein